MKRLTIAWDVDDTIITPGIATGSKLDTPNYETIAVLRWFQNQGHKIVIWSGSGVDWAKTWAEKLGLAPCEIRVKGEGHVDIAFDDCDVTLGKVNVKVSRVNNQISRKEWNEDKNNA